MIRSKEGDARPWMILSNHEKRPFHGDQYVALTLTSKNSSNFAEVR
ncbi:MAG: hypothetical protein ACQETI_11480 [Halobacteriota archaeon]